MLLRSQARTWEKLGRKGVIQPWEEPGAERVALADSHEEAFTRKTKRTD